MNWIWIEYELKWIELNMKWIEISIMNWQGAVFHLSTTARLLFYVKTFHFKDDMYLAEDANKQYLLVPHLIIGKTCY